LFAEKGKRRRGGGEGKEVSSRIGRGQIHHASLVILGEKLGITPGVPAEEKRKRSGPRIREG